MKFEAPKFDASRRRFIIDAVRVPSAILLTQAVNSACTLLPVPRDPTTSRREVIRRQVGEWTKEDIEQLAQAMMTDAQFQDIAHAGKILYKNQRGETAVSQESSLFNDGTIKIYTVESLSAEYPTMPDPVPIDAYVAQAQPILITTLESKDGSPDLPIQTGTSLSLKRIRIGKLETDGKSDFVLHYGVAKEVYNIKAFDLATSTFLNMAYPQYNLPEDALTRNALRTGIFDWQTPDGIPVSKIADIWAHFFMIPDYERAKEKGMISEREFFLESIASGYFKDVDILYKDGGGRYRWRTNDQNRWLEVWYRAAFATYKTFFLSEPYPQN